MATKERKKTKIVILVLAILLAMDLCALAGTYIYKRHASETNGTVSVPDNLITQEGAVQQDGLEMAAQVAVNKADVTAQELVLEQEQTGTVQDVQKVSQTQKTTQNTNNTVGTVAKKEAVSISLCQNHSEDNQPFSVGNMFPGDQETKFYAIQVSHHDKVTVHFRAYVREGYEKLAEVLMVRVALPSEDRVLYEGRMAEMPESVTHELAAAEEHESCLLYEITAYLDTSVGNEYQEKDLAADFRWWIEETENLDKGPKTGDTMNYMLWIGAILAAGAVCIAMVHIRKKEDRNHA